MFVTVWNNRIPLKSGSGYGLKLEIGDRDRFFRREWETILIELEGYANKVEVDITKPSFWGAACRELINAEFGRWLVRNKLTPWPKGQPPKLSLKHIKGNRFLLMKTNARNQMENL
jgi:hypothetical protein